MFYLILIIFIMVVLGIYSLAKVPLITDKKVREIMKDNKPEKEVIRKGYQPNKGRLDNNKAFKGRHHTIPVVRKRGEE